MRASTHLVQTHAVDSFPSLFSLQQGTASIRVHMHQIKALIKSANKAFLLTLLIKCSLSALRNTFDFSLDDVDHCDCETGYLPERKQKWYVNLTWDFTLRCGHQPIFLTIRPYEPLMCFASLRLRVRTTIGHRNPYVGHTISVL